MANESTNPTFETKGDFQSILLNRTNSSIYLRESQFTHHGRTSWEKGKDWTCFEKQYVPAFGKDGAGAYAVLTVKDRSFKHVELESMLTFMTEVILAGYECYIKLAFQLLPSDDMEGTVILPGFGLYDIAEKPGEWTYIWPKEYQDNWSVNVLASSYATPYTLSVLYKPLQKSRFTAPSAMIFSITGATFSQFDSIPGEEERGKAPATLEVLPTSDPYMIADGAL